MKAQLTVRLDQTLSQGTST